MIFHDRYTRENYQELFEKLEIAFETHRYAEFYLCGIRYSIKYQVPNGWVRKFKYTITDEFNGKRHYAHLHKLFNYLRSVMGLPIRFDKIDLEIRRLLRDIKDASQAANDT